MPFDAPTMMLVGLIKIELPAQTIRLCDGGFIYFGGEKYTSADDAFGSIETVEAIEENAGDEAPSGRLTFLPSSASAAGDLSQPEFQGSRARMWLARVDEATGTVLDSELVGDMELDTTTLRGARSSRRLDMEFISVAERLFNINEGNVLSASFHKAIWPGEQGLDNAVGVPSQVAWGVNGAQRGAVVSGSSSAGASSGAQFNVNQVAG